MKTPKEIYSIIETLNRDVKEHLKRRGLVVPIKQNDGSIRLGSYVVKKTNSTFYSILDYRDRPIVENINLPQTAILVANKLALRKWIDTDLLQADKKYGYCLFDEQAHSKTARSSLGKHQYDRAEILINKSEISKHKKEYYKKSILNNFQKLLEFR